MEGERKDEFFWESEASYRHHCFWARLLLQVSPRYVRDPERLRGYIRGPNWDAPGPEYAHYKSTVTLYGNELLGLFERMREDGDAGIDEYRKLLAEAEIMEVK